MTKEELIKKKISAISLGCDKNRVDLEKMLFKLKNYGFEIVADPIDANIVIVNTCAFILPAKQESIDQIIEMEFLKKKGKIEKVVVSGCFPERNLNELKENFPDIDAFVRIKDNDNIVKVISKLYEINDTRYKSINGRLLTTPQSYAYLKIADGCNNACSYCIIPRIRGRYRSYKMEDLVKEAEDVVKNGVKEIILVAQDTSRYGEDLYSKNELITLCKKLIKIKDLKKIRLHYLYPEKMSDELLNFISTEEKMCKYIDIPLQHIDDQILTSMRRRMNEEDTRNLIKNIKENYNNLALRTTFIVGYPGESRKQFKKLERFVKETGFDYAGFFPYYREENTASYFMKKQIKNFVKKRRLKKISKLQAKISLKKAEELFGEQIVLIDSFDETSGNFMAHTEKQSPGVDFGVIVSGENIKVGDYVKINITSFDGENFGGEKLWIYQIE